MNQNNNVWTFMLVAYGFSELFWIPDALIAQGIWNSPESLKNFFAGPLNLGPWGQLFAAIVVTFMYQGGPGVKDLLKRGIMTRFGKMITSRRCPDRDATSTCGGEWRVRQVPMISPPKVTRDNLFKRRLRITWSLFATASSTVSLHKNGSNYFMSSPATTEKI
ncbi:MAG: hypothetical protein P8Y14_22750 [Anaerolineales bacterium]